MTGSARRGLRGDYGRKAISVDTLISLFKKHIRNPYRNRQVAVWVLSVPKSGRTWLRAMLGIYIATIYKYDKSKSLDLSRMCRSLGIPTISLSHNGSSFSSIYTSCDDELADPNLWKGKKVIHLSRDVKDILVSGYHHFSYRNNAFEDGLSEFIRNPVTGAEKVLRSEFRWKKNRKLAADWLDITYEQMSEDPTETLLAVVKFVGLPVDKAALSYAVDFCSADNMKGLEKSGFFSHGSMRPSEGGEKAMKVRQASVGGYIEHLSTEDIAYIENVSLANKLTS